MDKSQVLFTTCYASRQVFFEASVELLFNHGYQNWLIQNTISIEPALKYGGITDTGIEVFDTGVQNHMGALALNEGRIKSDPKYKDMKYIVVLDNDTMFSGVQELDLILETIEKENYGCVGAFRHARFYNDKERNDNIVIPFTSIEYDEWPETLTMPYISGAFTIFRRDIFDRYSMGEWINSQLRMQQDGVLRGSYYTTHLSTATYYSKEWIHWGATAYLWFIIAGTLAQREREQFMADCLVDPILHFKIGQLLAEQKYCPRFPGLAVNYLNSLFHSGVDKQKCIDVWNETIKNIPPCSQLTI